MAAADLALQVGHPQRPVFRHPQAQREICLGECVVAYALRRVRRRTIGFVVGAEGLSVNAPKWVGLRDIEAALQEKSGWIVRKLLEQQERGRRLQSLRVEWIDGTRLPFLGGTLVVKIDPLANGVELQQRAHRPSDDAAMTLRVGLAYNVSPHQMRDAVQSWLQRQAKRVFEERCAHFAALLGVQVTKIALSNAQTRWGSANANGAIRLNWRLIHFGMTSIDYVVAHELAHLREMNHSPRFWDVVRSVLPDYELGRGPLRDGMVPLLD